MTRSKAYACRSFAACLVLVALPLAGGCASGGGGGGEDRTTVATSEPTQLSGIRDVVVLADPVRQQADPLDRVAAGEAAQFLKRRGFAVRDERTTQLALDEFRLQEQGLTSPEGRIEIGRRLSIQAYMFVSVEDVLEETYQPEKNGTVIDAIEGLGRTFKNSKQTRARVRFTLTDVETGNMLWSDQGDGEISGHDRAGAVRAASESVMTKKFHHVAGVPANLAQR